MKIRLRPSLLISALLLLIRVPTAWAYYDILDTGEILPSGNYRLLGGAQLLTDRGGFNVNTAIDAGFREEFGLRGILGFGSTDVFAGGYFKWIPIPDIEGQPAMGARAGVLYGKDGGTRDLSFRLEPMISKKFAVGSAFLTPYASLPMGINAHDSENGSNKTEITWQLVAGSQMQFERWKKLQFMAEIGVDLQHALSHVSLAAVLYFDEENGIAIE